MCAATAAAAAAAAAAVEFKTFLIPMYPHSPYCPSPDAPSPCATAQLCSLWFLETRLVRLLFREAPYTFATGEDMQLSHM